jgi:hypothetical protein
MTPQANGQRNAIAQAMMNVGNPPPPPQGMPPQGY